MVLLLEGVIVDPSPYIGNLDEFLKLCHDCPSVVSSFSVDSNRVFSCAGGVLYVAEGEWATIRSDCPIKIIGADEATTCHIVAVHDAKHELVSLAHLNGWETSAMLHKMVQTFGEVTSLDIHILGGFLDDRQLSAKLAEEILSTIHDMAIQFNLSTACFYSFNSVVRDGKNFPLFYGLAVDTASKKIFPADFKVKEPDMVIRSCRIYESDRETLSISEQVTKRCCFDPNTCEFVISPIKYECPYYAAHVLRFSDEYILENFSTSPDQEREGFVHHIKDALSYMLRNRDWRTVFPNNKPRRYRLSPDSVSWHLV